jgi:hypothetical protein
MVLFRGAVGAVYHTAWRHCANVFCLGQSHIVGCGIWSLSPLTPAETPVNLEWSRRIFRFLARGMRLLLRFNSTRKYFRTPRIQD